MENEALQKEIYDDIDGILNEYLDGNLDTELIAEIMFTILLKIHTNWKLIINVQD